MSIRITGRYKPRGILRFAPLVTVPSFETLASITPTSGQMGTTFTGVDPIVRNAVIINRAWLLNGVVVPNQTLNTYLSDGTGSLVYRVTARGQGGTVVSSSTPVTVTANPAKQNAPRWITQPGLLGTFAEGSSISIPLQASDQDNNIASYSITGGTLPNGTSLNMFDGLLSGTLAEVASDTVYTFEITVTDRTNLKLVGSFSINVANVKTTVVWNTDNDQSLASPAPGEPVSVSLGASSS